VARAPETHRMELATVAAIQADVNRQWKQGPVVEVAGGWVGELHRAIPELEGRSAMSGSGRTELALARCLTVGWAVAESWVAWR
jgi:hypothetical protein